MNKRAKITVVLILIIGIVLAIGTATIQSYRKENQTLTGNYILTQKITEINPTIISKFLPSLGTEKLHKNLLTREKPRICLIIDNEEYLCTIDKKIEVKKINCSNQDINIIATKQEVLNAINGNIKEYIRDAVWDERIQIELIAGNVELFAKGYLNLYNNF